MDANVRRKIICALDTGCLDEAKETVAKFKDYAGAFKIGHGLTLPNGLDVVDELREAGADRIFLDLKLHDIPSSVAIGVREAAKRGVWMMTLHLSGGPAMITAAVVEAHEYALEERPLLVGVSVLTSLDQHVLTDHLGVQRPILDHMKKLSSLGVECGLDGVVTSAHECSDLRSTLGHEATLVVPGIRPRSGEKQDQTRTGDAAGALAAGASYLVIGRALTAKPDPVEALRALGLDVDA
jgi:orotidine-5'-phosphate decarboxylase